MSIEAFHIASAVFAGTTVGFAHLSWGLRKMLKSANEHVASLQNYLSEQSSREDLLIRERNELLAFYNKTKAQRVNALKAAAAKRAEKSVGKTVADCAAREKTLTALRVTPLRSRSEVVADVHRSARQAPSAG